MVVDNLAQKIQSSRSIMSQVSSPTHLFQQKMFTKSFSESQLPHKSVNLFFTITDIKSQVRRDARVLKTFKLKMAQAETRIWP